MEKNPTLTESLHRYIYIINVNIKGIHNPKNPNTEEHTINKTLTRIPDLITCKKFKFCTNLRVEVSYRESEGDAGKDEGHPLVALPLPLLPPGIKGQA